MSKWWVMPCLIALALGPVPGEAKRLPEPGGEVRVQVLGDDIGAFEENHLSVRLLERGRRAGVGRGDGWYSRVIRVEPDDTAAARWSLTTRVQRAFVLRSLKQCLMTDTTRWPARVLAAAGISVKVSMAREEIFLVFSQPVGAVRELLSGCWLQSAFASGGGFRRVQPTVLEASDDGLVPRPLLDRVRLVGDAEQADIRIGRGKAGEMGRVIAAAYPDVLVLIQRGEIAQVDPLGVAAKAKPGLAAFYEQFAAGTLVQFYAGGHGMASRGILPPGIAEPHPLPRVTLEHTVKPLVLSAEVGSETEVSVYVDPGDKVAKGFEDRLSLFLRSRAIAAKRVDTESGLKDGFVVFRWRPQTRDPGISVLELMSRFRELRVNDDGLLLKLLAGARATRLEAALEVERRWIDARRVIPLATLDVWYGVAPGLEGVWVSDEGVPVLDSAYWRGAP